MPEHRRFMRMRPRARAMGACVAIALLMASMLAALPANGAPTGRPHVRVLAPGVAITTYIDRRFPIRTYVLTVDPSQGGVRRRRVCRTTASPAWRRRATSPSDSARSPR